MTGRNETWAARSQAAVWHPCTQMKALADGAAPLVPIAAAEGPWLVDAEGKRILDGISSWWVNILGHGHPALRAALHDQIDRLDHVMLAGLTHAPVVELSERLGALTDLGHAFYASDGASATEIALKMSAHYWRNIGRPEKNRFVGVAGGYHGETAGALSVTDIPVFRDAYAPLVRVSDTVMSPDDRQAQAGETDADVAARAAQALADWFEQHHATTAALIVEPLVQCAAGMAMHHESWLRAVRALCTRYQVHLVVDEIATGFGRTGTLFAHQQAGIKPDFVCLSKGLTGGTLALAAVLTTDTVYEAFWDDDTARGFLHSHSYTGNPLACRAALATLDVLEREHVLLENAERARRWTTLFAPLTSHPAVRRSRHRGMIWAWDIDVRRPHFSRRYAAHALRHGVLLRPIGTTLYAMPPYLMDDAAARHLAQGALAALDAAWAEEQSQ